MWKNAIFSVKKCLTHAIYGGYNEKHNGNTKIKFNWQERQQRKTMKKIIYRNPNDAENFDLARFLKSLGRYAKIDEKENHRSDGQ